MATPAPAVVPRYVELIRVSGQAQANRDTPQDQRAALDQLRVSRPGILVERIEEGAIHAVSGAADLANRPDLQRLMELATARAFDEVRVRRLDRLTRHADPRERFAIFGAIMDAGAVIVDASGHTIDPKTELGEVDYFFQGLMASRERKLIAERTGAARLRKAKDGAIQARPPYARTWDKKTGKWDVKQPELDVYKRLFSEYLAGKSCKKIANTLNEEGVAAPGSWWKRESKHWKHPLMWTSGSVYALLSHRSAVGEITSCGQKIVCPPVVDPATFEKAQERLKAKNWLAGRPAADDLNALLRGLATCSECGSRMWVARGGSRGRYVVYYVCARYQTAKEPVCRRMRRVEAVDAKLKSIILNILDGRGIYKRALDHGKVETVDPEKDAAAAKRALAALEKREENLVRLQTKGLVSSKVGEKQLAEIQRERRESEARLTQASMSKEHRAEEAKATKDREAEVRRMRKGIESADFAGWRRLVDVVVRDVMRDPLKIDSKGDVVIGAQGNITGPKHEDDLARHLGRKP